MNQREYLDALVKDDILGDYSEFFQNGIYAVLRRLCAGGNTEIRVEEEASGGPARKYYRITPLGRRTLRASLKEWWELCEAVEKLGIGAD